MLASKIGDTQNDCCPCGVSLNQPPKQGTVPRTNMEAPTLWKTWFYFRLRQCTPTKKGGRIGGRRGLLHAGLGRAVPETGLPGHPGAATRRGRAPGLERQHLEAREDGSTPPQNKKKKRGPREIWTTPQNIFSTNICMHVCQIRCKNADGTLG